MIRTFPGILFVLNFLLFLSCNNSAEQGKTNTGTSPAIRDNSVLKREVDSFLKQVPGRVGFSYVNMGTGANFSCNGGDSFAMFSTYKLPLVVYALHLAAEGKLSLTQSVRISAKALEDYRSGEFVRRYSGRDVSMPVDSLIWYAMAYSDNLTTDHLFTLVGGPAAVNDFVHKKGVAEMQIRHTVMEMSKGNSYRENFCTPIAMTQLLRLLYEGRMLNQASRDYLLNYMRLAPSGSRRIKSFLPHTASVAHKTGTGNTVQGITAGVNDVGYFTLPNGSVVALSVYINDIRAEVAEAEDVIATVARMVYDHENAQLAADTASKN